MTHHSKKNVVKIACFVGAVCMLTACCAQKNATDQNAACHKSAVGCLPAEIDFSNSFRMFWDAFVQDTKHIRSLDKYKPSGKLLQNAAVSEHNGEYIVSGFITTGDGFDENAFTALGGTLTKIDATTATFQMPLKHLPEMWQINGIESVEAATRIHLRKY